MLSKSDFLSFLDNPLHFWAAKHGHAHTTPDPASRFLMRQGYQVEELAIDYLKTTLGDSNTTFRPQHSVTHHQLKARADLWVETLLDPHISIYEIKGSTRLKSKHVWDAAFQYHVYSKHHPIKAIHIVHLNPNYRLIDVLKPNQFLEIHDVTSEAITKLPQLKTHITSALKLLDLPEPPLDFACHNPKTCPCPDICFDKHLAPTSIHFLGGPRPADLPNSVTDIRHIPTDTLLKPIQAKQVESAQQNKPIIDSTAIQTFLDRLEFPLWFLDYETINFAIPRYQNHAPHQHIPFQYSLHRLDKPNTPPLHYFYVHNDTTDPIPSLLKKLESDLSTEGSVLVWYKHFETARNRYMSEIVPSHLNFIQNLNNRIIDLMEPFAKGHWVDYRFQGSHSIKNVLPVLAPDLSYKNLSIGNGGLALVSWHEMIYGDKPQTEKDQIQKDLLDYCKLDTLAMVKIYLELYSHSTN